MGAHNRLKNDDGSLECSPQQKEFIDWLLNPKRQGTQKEQAARLGVHPNSLLGWKKEKHFRTEWEKRAAELNVSFERIQEVVDAIHEKAKSGDTNAAKLYLEYVNKFTPTQRVVVEDKSVRSLSDEELAAQLEDNVRALRAV